MSSLYEDEQAITAWINEISTYSRVFDDFLSLKNGIILAELLERINPNFFQTMKTKLIQTDEYNFAFNFKNLNVIFNEIQHYFNEVLNLNPKEFKNINIMSICKDDNKNEIYSLLELIIYIIICSPENSSSIKAILKLEEKNQVIIKSILEKCLNIFGHPKKNTNLPKTITSPEKNEEFRTEKEKKILEKLDELENENYILIIKLKESQEYIQNLEYNENELKEIILKKNIEVETLKKDMSKLKEENFQKNDEQIQNDLNLQERKIKELNKYLESITSDYEKKLTVLNNEISEQQESLQKKDRIITSLEHHKNEHTNYYEKFKELSKKYEEIKQKNDDFLKKQDQNESKQLKYQEKIETLQTEKLNLELEISKISTEIVKLNEKTNELQYKLNKKEDYINELIIKLDNMNYEQTIRSFSPERNLKNELNGLLTDDALSKRKENEDKIDIEDYEFLQKENKILVEKCKELQNNNNYLENQIKIFENKEKYEDLVLQNENLTKELQNFKKDFGSQKNLLSERKKLIQESKTMKEEFDAKTKINEQNILKIKSLEEQIKTNLDQNNEKENLIQELKEENEFLHRHNEKTLKSKDEEINLIISAMFNLTKKNNTLPSKIDLPKKNLESAHFKRNSYAFIPDTKKKNIK